MPRLPFLLVLALALPVGGVAGAAGETDALAACESAALAEMQARHPDAADVQALEDQVKVAETPGGQTEVTGGGQFAETVGAWTSFTYSCTFSPTTGEVTSIELR